MRARSLLAIAVLLLAAGCTGDQSPPTEAPPTSIEGPPTSDVPGEQVPGEWVYELYGVKATFLWKKAGPATLTVKNGSDQEVGSPGVYIVTRDQRHVDGKVANASPLDPSASGDFTVTFPDGLVPDDVGLVVLELGGVNWGALGPKLVGS